MKASFGIKKEKLTIKDLKEQKRILLEQIDNWVQFLKSNFVNGILELPETFLSKYFVVENDMLILSVNRITAKYWFRYDSNIIDTLETFKKKVKRLYPVKLSYKKDLAKEDTKFYDTFQTEYYTNKNQTMIRRRDKDYKVNYKV